MTGTRSIAGHSLVLNTLLVVFNLVGVTFLFLAFQEALIAYHLLFLILGSILLAITTLGIVFFKGKLMLASVSRVLVGTVFIVSGLIKANDPIGFSYKLAEYFEDGALAYRVKEAFGWHEFSLSFLIDSSLSIAVVICLLEILLGVLVLIGGKMRLTSWLLAIVMLFFTFLTWHTASCNQKTRYTDRDTYALTSTIAQAKIDASKTNKDVRIISKSAEEVVVEEMKTPQCVTDCGCFGDAMKGAVGRSLTPNESFWKDLVLLYLVAWIFAAQKQLKPNSVKDNWVIVSLSLILTAGLSWLFNWYFPLLFSALTLMGALWFFRSGGKLLGNHYGSMAFTLLLSGVFVGYVLRYDPLKDYRPFAVGADLNKKVKDGGFDGKTLVFPSVDTNQFNPSMAIRYLSESEKELPFIKTQLKNRWVGGYRLRELATNEIIRITKDEYNVESYANENYNIIDTIQLENPDLKRVNVFPYLRKAPLVLTIVSANIRAFQTEALEQFEQLIAAAKKQHIPVVLIAGGTFEDGIAFKRKHGLEVPVFMNNELEMKAISRSNPSLLILKHGIIKGKYTYHSLPTLAWIQTSLLTK